MKTRSQRGSDGIEKRCKSEELEQRKAKRSRSSLQLSTAPGEPCDDPPTILEFPMAAVDNAGIFVENETVIMYCREDVKALFRSLHGVLHKSRPVFNKKVNPYQLPWIIGPSGVGKSLAVFAFTQSPQVSEWAVTWIHCLGGKWFSSYHRYQTEEETSTFQLKQSVKHLAKLKVENQHIWVLDGFTDETSATMLADCEDWLQADFEKRRLFVTCSIASRRKGTETHDLKLRVKEFSVCAWTLEEYKAAVGQPQLYDAVKEKLGTDTDKSRDELVESKHYFAGGSARYMFQVDTDEVKVALDNAIEKVSEVQIFATGGIDLSSTAFVHRLIFIQHGRRGVVSRYAGHRLAVKLGTRLVEQFLYGSEISRPMKGFLFEMWFIAKLSREGITYLPMNHRPQKAWAQSKAVYMPSEEEKLFPKSRTWFQAGWNNGGFDAVYVDPKKKTVRFVQIMLNNNHSFKIEFFQKFLNRLEKYMHTKTREIFFVYPVGASSKKLVTTGEGSLSLFQWKKGKEWNNVTKVMLDWPGFHRLYSSATFLEGYRSSRVWLVTGNV
ncbi:unnamed protein product [Calypogeia fissa]